MTSFEPTPGVEVHALLRSTRLDLAQRILGTRMANVTYTEDAWTSHIYTSPRPRAEND